MLINSSGSGREVGIPEQIALALERLEEIECVGHKPRISGVERMVLALAQGGYGTAAIPSCLASSWGRFDIWVEESVRRVEISYVGWYRILRVAFQLGLDIDGEGLG